MERHRLRQKAICILPALIAFSQVPAALAYPQYQPPFQNTSFQAPPIPSPEEQGPPPAETPITTEAVFSLSRSPIIGNDWSTTYTVSQIRDGQLQAPPFAGHAIDSTTVTSVDITSVTAAVTATDAQPSGGDLTWPGGWSSHPGEWTSPSGEWSTQEWTASDSSCSTSTVQPTTSNPVSATPSVVTSTAAPVVETTETFVTSIITATSTTSTGVVITAEPSLTTSSSEPVSSIPSTTAVDVTTVSTAVTSVVTSTDTTILTISSVTSEGSIASSSSLAASTLTPIETEFTSSTSSVDPSPVGTETSTSDTTVADSSVAAATSAETSSSDNPLTTDLTSVVSTSTLFSTITQSIISSNGQTTTSVQSIPLISTVTVESTVTRFITTTIPETALTTLTTSAVQSATPPPAQTTDTSGTVQTSLESPGTSAQPFPTEPVTRSTSLSLINTSTLSSVGPTNTPETSLSADNIFQPLQTDAPPPQISQVSDHPVPRLGIQPQQQKLPTNKFYANFYLGSQESATWTHPFSVWWAQGLGDAQSWGLSIAHRDREGMVTGDASTTTGAISFFVNPLGVTSLSLSAAQLGSGSNLTTDTLEAFSVNVNLVPAGSTNPAITFPLVQGMGYVTGVYHSVTPLIQSGVGVSSLTYGGVVSQDSSVHKYRAELLDGTLWLIYITPQSSTYDVNRFTLINTQNIQGPDNFEGTIQVTKVPTTDYTSGNSTGVETVYDQSAGAYATGVNITGAVHGRNGSYTLARNKAGVQDVELLMFALPHHMQSLSGHTKQGVTSVQLMTTTKGMATAVRGDDWTLIEKNLPIGMGFAPWTPALGSVRHVSSQAQEAIVAAATLELTEDMEAQTNLNSAYYAGKALAKFAGLIYAVHDIGGNATVALTGLQALEQNFARWVNNTQQYPFYYESAWGGTVSSASYVTDDPGVDFGNTYYNDHHFHYGYFVYAASVIGYLDPSWLDQGTNKAWVNNLVRDYSNPISDDPYYSFSRMFDWYHGHSWAAGLFESSDGKNQESSSEDTMASYAIKMWGRIVGDTNMEARGNLMLAVQKRSLGNYYLYLDSNTIEPADFVGNKVAGILFENKIDHTTFFGTNIEYIEGIHMLPQLPLSAYTRTKRFVQQEWNTYFTSYVNQVTGGWRGILMANYATIDPTASYQFFSNATGNFLTSYLDGGASQTWYLAWSAALGGSPAEGAPTKRDVGEEEMLMIREEGWEEEPVQVFENLKPEKRESIRSEEGKMVSTTNDNSKRTDNDSNESTTTELKRQQRQAATRRHAMKTQQQRAQRRSRRTASM